MYLKLDFQNVAIYADDTTPFCKCEQTFDLCHKFEFASGQESDLQYTVDWVGSDLLIIVCKNLASDLAWNAVCTPELELLIAT